MFKSVFFSLENGSFQEHVQKQSQFQRIQTPCIVLPYMKYRILQIIQQEILCYSVW